MLLTSHNNKLFYTFVTDASTMMYGGEYYSFMNTADFYFAIKPALHLATRMPSSSQFDPTYSIYRSHIQYLICSHNTKNSLDRMQHFMPQIAWSFKSHGTRPLFRVCTESSPFLYYQQQGTKSEACALPRREYFKIISRLATKFYPGPLSKERCQVLNRAGKRRD